jgi:hypothetical protein
VRSVAFAVACTGAMALAVLLASVYDPEDHATAAWIEGVFSCTFFAWVTAAEVFRNGPRLGVWSGRVHCTVSLFVTIVQGDCPLHRLLGGVVGWGFFNAWYRTTLEEICVEYVLVCIALSAICRRVIEEINGEAATRRECAELAAERKAQAELDTAAEQAGNQHPALDTTPPSPTPLSSLIPDACRLHVGAGRPPRGIYQPAIPTRSNTSTSALADNPPTKTLLSSDEIITTRAGFQSPVHAPAPRSARAKPASNAPRPVPRAARHSSPTFAANAVFDRHAGSVSCWSGQFSVDTDPGGPAMPTIREDDEGESTLKMRGRGTGVWRALRAIAKARGKRSANGAAKRQKPSTLARLFRGCCGP